MREAQLMSYRDLAIKLALSEWGGRGPEASKVQTQNVKNGTINQVVYGRPSPPLISYCARKTTNNCADQQLKERYMIINALKENLVIAQNRMKKQADLRWRELNFQVGEEVYLKLRPYQQ